MSKSVHVNANQNLLPPGWYRDEYFAEQVYDQVRVMSNRGHTDAEVARSVGVSERLVGRHRARGWRLPSRKAAVFRSKLTPKEVLKIRELYATGEYTQERLGRMFNVSKSAVYHVRTRKTWSNLE